MRVRPTSDPHQIVIAFPWRHRGRAQALGRAVAEVLDAVPGSDIEAAVSRAAASVGAADPGPGPTTITPKIPVVAVTGTNGKTTTSRMIAHIARTSGLLVGWSNTDGIYIDGELVEAGDYSGPSGAGRVLAHPQVRLAVTETARGGILLKGIGLTRNDVSVVTNVTADHLGLHGIDTVDQLAEVKGVVPNITRKGGWAVLNADDPRVFAMRTTIKAHPWVFSRDPDSPAIREILSHGGGRATTVIDGWVSVLRPDADADPLVELVDVPMTLAGLSRFNVENTLAAASAALAIGLSREAVVDGLRSFRPDAEHNPGRMNLFSLPGDFTVVMDLAHNEAGLEALLEIMNGVRRPGRAAAARPRRGRRPPGRAHRQARRDRRDGQRRGGHRPQAGVPARADRWTSSTGCCAPEPSAWGSPTSRPTPPRSRASRPWSSRRKPGDVVGLMCHAEREECYAWIADHGGTADTPETLSDKVRAAAG